MMNSFDNIGQKVFLEMWKIGQYAMCTKLIEGRNYKELKYK